MYCKELSPLEKKVIEIFTNHFSNDCPNCRLHMMDVEVIAKETTPYYSFLYLNKQKENAALLPQSAVCEVRLYQNNRVPIQCLLHIKKHSTIIEIFCADSSMVPVDCEIERYEIIDTPMI